MQPEDIHIKRDNKLSTAEDFQNLRRQGITLIENLSGKIWTDYNTHDPGITLLEALCYAITEHAYKTNFDIQDLLAHKVTGNNYTQKDFYTAHQVLPCNPVTLMDYRKLIIDVAGVKNAWVEINNDYEVPIFIDSTPGKNDDLKFKLTYDSKKGDKGVLQLKGLYKAFVEFDDDVLKEKREEEVLNAVMAMLHRHRNLCEDFVSVAPVEMEWVAIEAEVKVKEGFDIDEINGKIYDVINNFLSPPVRFYSLDEMIRRNYTTEEIFEGPLLKHGFIDSRDLLDSRRSKEIYLSDIINIISNVEGVMAVNKLSVPRQSQSPFSDFTEWHTTVRDKQKSPRLDIENSIVKFTKSGDRYRAMYENYPDKNRVQSMYSFLQNSRKKSKLKETEKDFEVKPGEFMNIEEYYPVQKTLPLCYGMDEKYINEIITEEEIRSVKDVLSEKKKTSNERINRLAEFAEKLSGDSPIDLDIDINLSRLKAEEIKWQISQLDKKKRLALQLRGFLLIFEQILANYLSQLANVRSLFSIDDTVEHTYFRNMLDEVNDLEALFIDYSEYVKTQSRTSESDSNFTKRRNAFLDHLMARFGETMSSYPSGLKTNRNQNPGTKLIRDKTLFLKDYIMLSNYRGVGFDYKNVNKTWNTDNVPGVKKRICRLLGIADYSRKRIASHSIRVIEIKHENDIKRYEVILDDPDNKNEVLLKSIQYEFEEEAYKILNYIIKYGSERSRYQLDGKKGNYSYSLLMETQNGNYEIVAHKRYQDNDEMEQMLKKTIKVLSGFAAEENFHIVEHILLRPRINAREKYPKKQAATIDADSVTLLPPPESVLPGITKQNTGNEKKEKQIEKEKENIPYYEFRISNIRETWKLSLVNESGSQVLFIKDDFAFYKHLTKRIEQLRETASDQNNYVIKTDRDGRFGFTIMDGTQVIAESKVKFQSSENASVVMDTLVKFFSYELHANVKEPGEDEMDISPYLDPYSFNISIILPDWVARFRDAGFKHLLEKAIYLETPAHIAPNVYWIDHRQMRQFESVYRAWLEDQAEGEIPNTEILNNLIFELNEIRDNSEI